MLRKPIDIHREIPWIGQPAIYLIDGASDSALTSSLAKLGYFVRHIDGTKITDKRSMFEQFNDAFMFSQYAYAVFNWDAFDESLEVLLQSLESPLAVLWHDAFAMMSTAPSDFLNSVRYLVNESVPTTCNYPDENYVQFNIFFLGSGTGFRSHLAE